MVLSLPNIIGSNFIKDFPAANTVIQNAVDDYAGPCLTSHPLQSYTPVLSAVTVAPTLGGAGSLLRGFFYEIFDQIYTWGEFRFGTGFAAGTGVFLLSLPFPAKTLLGVSTSIGAAPVVGGGQVWDASADGGRSPVSAHLRTVTQMFFGTQMGGAGPREVSSGNMPITWAVGDGLTWHARYQRTP